MTVSYRKFKRSYSSLFTYVFIHLFNLDHSSLSVFGSIYLSAPIPSLSVCLFIGLYLSPSSSLLSFSLSYSFSVYLCLSSLTPFPSSFSLSLLLFNSIPVSHSLPFPLLLSLCLSSLAPHRTYSTDT